MRENRIKLCETEIANVPPGCNERFLPLHTSPLRLLEDAGVRFSGVGIECSGYAIARRAPLWHTMLYTVSGEGALATENRHYRLTRGTLWTGPAKVAHNYRAVRAPWKLAWLCLDPKNRLHIFPTEPQVIRSALGNAIDDMMRRIITEGDTRQQEYLLFMETYARVLHLLIKRDIFTSSLPPVDSRLMALEHFIQLVRNNPANPWTLDSMRRASGLSVGPDRFRQLCVTHFGKTPIQLITEIRMEIARELLASTDYLIYNIAGLVGYENEYAFTAAFHRGTGESPTNYRVKFKATRAQRLAGK